MKKYLTLLLCLLFISLQGCQTHFLEKDVAPMAVETPLAVTTPIIQTIDYSTTIEQVQLYQLLVLGGRYAELEEPQRKIACQQLKEDYRIQADWQAAWLLVYAVNHNFNCINISRAIELLHTMAANPDTSTSLQWMNSNQINVLHRLQKLQIEKVKVSNQLKKAQTELKQENSKIEELKAIESEINKKLDNVEMQLEQENNKIEELKAIETDMNKKLDE
ncbi:MAG: hypothetical protein COA83_07730 [Methylophaga sp.]|nr:MAG: hypothetical protein COA83_07730 [Methylophaga sp.]